MEHRLVEKSHWRCDVYVAIHSYKVDEVIRALDECGAPDAVLTRAKERMERDDVDTGFTFSNPRTRRSVMVIGKTSEGKQFLNSFVHELRHLVDDIAVTDSLEMSGEAVAYLSGDIAMELADFVCSLSCDHCRQSR